MNQTDYYKKGACKCHNPKCGKVFQSNEIKHIYRESLGQQVIQGVCPHCENTYYGYGLINYPVDEFDLLYKKFEHRNTYKKLRKELDKIVEQIFREDEFVREVNRERMSIT